MVLGNANVPNSFQNTMRYFYSVAGHVQLSCNKKKDVLKQYNEDCKVAEKVRMSIIVEYYSTIHHTF